MLRNQVKKHISCAKHAPRGRPYDGDVTKKRQPPAKTLAENLNKLMAATGWSNRHLAQLAGVSDRYIGMIRKSEYKATVEIAEALAKPFGLTAWQLIMPNLDAELARNGALEALIQNYQASSQQAREYIDSVAEREGKYLDSNGG